MNCSDLHMGQHETDRQTKVTHKNYCHLMKYAKLKV